MSSARLNPFATKIRIKPRRMISYFSAARSRSGSNQASKASNGSCGVDKLLLAHSRDSLGGSGAKRGIEDGEKLSQTTINSKSLCSFAANFALDDAAGIKRIRSQTEYRSQESGVRIQETEVRSQSNAICDKLISNTRALKDGEFIWCLLETDRGQCP